ncbi:hypothetical protein [Pseudomonas azerbaijanorientalis]|uniref:hypothetical protein n=1 Tax=Pseudomonas azerbaijanorientalis TaxID=2842350 RepID=UPI001C3DBE2A|nr:hypothetical protein [Pseudomonas azerbaijanorientalis]QXH64407.1 hypothetical protein KSS91_13415 [Pseudomonas azerbaijanorientalis]
MYLTASPTRKQALPSAVMFGPIRIAKVQHPPSGMTIANFVDRLSTLTSLIALIVPCPLVFIIGVPIRPSSLAALY